MKCNKSLDPIFILFIYLKAYEIMTSLFKEELGLVFITKFNIKKTRTSLCVLCVLFWVGGFLLLRAEREIGMTGYLGTGYLK